MWRLIVTCAVALALSRCGAPDERAAGLRQSGRVLVNDRVYDRFDVRELGPCVSIDDGNDEPLNNVRDVLGDAKLHHSIVSARDNLNQCGDILSGDLAVVGHGAVGAAYVGGAGSRQSGKYVGSDNPAEWEPLVVTLRKGTGHLSFLSCNTGAERRGAKLLSRLASATGRRVRALNGLAFYHPGEILLEHGATWNDAAPGRPAIVKPRPRPKYAPFKPVKVITLGGSTFAVSAMTKLTVAGLGVPNEVQTLAPDGDASFAFSRVIDFEHPFIPPGPPLAARTGEIEIESERGYKRRLIIYGDALAQDAADPRYYFDVDPEPLGTFLSAFR